MFTGRNAAFGLAGLLVLVIVSPFLRQSLEMGEAQGQLDALAPRMRLVDQLHHRIAGAGAGGEAVVAETRRCGRHARGAGAVTDLLPDDSYLTEFDTRERKMTLSGMSSSAPKLISALSQGTRVKNPAFTAPVTRENNHDVFSIRADLGQ